MSKFECRHIYGNTTVARSVPCLALITGICNIMILCKIPILQHSYSAISDFKCIWCRVRKLLPNSVIVHFIHHTL